MTEKEKRDELTSLQIALYRLESLKDAMEVLQEYEGVPSPYSILNKLEQIITVFHPYIKKLEKVEKEAEK